MPRHGARVSLSCFFFFNDTATTEIYTLSLHDALPISSLHAGCGALRLSRRPRRDRRRSEEHTSELQSRSDLVCRLLLEKKKTIQLRGCAAPLFTSSLFSVTDITLA